MAGPTPGKSTRSEIRWYGCMTATTSPLWTKPAWATACTSFGTSHRSGARFARRRFRRLEAEDRPGGGSALSLRASPGSGLRFRRTGSRGTHVGRGARRRKAEFLTQEEANTFLDAARVQRPHRYPLFLAALRTGMRLGELLALEWDDIQFGESEDDPNRYILVRKHFVRGRFVTPKSGKERRVDLTRELRRALLELRDQKLLEAFKKGQEGISALVFPSDTGGPLDGVNLYHRDFLPCPQAAPLRRVTFHALRHSYASLLIRPGASLAYVKEKMRHSSIQVAVDIYGHLIPGANIAWADALDTATSPQQSATQPPTESPTQEAPSNEAQEIVAMPELVGGPTRTRTWDQRIMSPLL